MATKVQLNGSLSMELTAAPPARLTSGKSLPQALTVVLISSGLANGTADLKDINGVWAYVSLMSADGKESLAPPREDLLRGRKANSIKPISRDLQNRGNAVGIAEFSDLAVLQAGRYRFRINIVGMGSLSGDGNGGRVLPDLYTNVFDVV